MTDSLIESLSLTGLTEEEAVRRRTAEGPNELSSAKERSLIVQVFEVVKEPMFLLLLACGGLYLALGDRTEAAVLLGFVVVMISITLRQERKTERALTALRDLSSPRALVFRDGGVHRVPGREVVRGDLIVLREGDRVAADGRLEHSLGLSVDESLLSGESLSVRKRAATKEELAAATLDSPQGDDLSSVFSGSLVVGGMGYLRVVAIGSHTVLGQIGTALRDVETRPSPLRDEMARIVARVAAGAAALSGIVALAYGLLRGDWLRGLLAGLTLAMAMLPEEFPVVLTVFLALGAWRISTRKVLTRRSSAIETLGQAQFLCVDKTGTLTENRMTVDRLWVDGSVLILGPSPLPEDFHRLAEYAILASQQDPFDPMEIALRDIGRVHLLGTEHLHEGEDSQDEKSMRGQGARWTLVRQYPLSRDLLALSHVWTSPDRTDLVVAAKGAPEAIFDLCHLDAARTDELGTAVDQLAREGLRVIAVARAAVEDSALPPEQHDFSFEFVGLVGLRDPVKVGVREAVEECHAAGVRVLMITGDYAATARSVGRLVGLSTEKVVTGPELRLTTDEQVNAKLDSELFARMVPDQKLHLVELLQRQETSWP